MPSVFTIKGTEVPKKKRKKRKRSLDGASYSLGECKDVYNSRTGCTLKLCKTGKGKTGWSFLKGSSKCPRK